MDEDVCGFDYFGCDEAIGFDTMSLIKKEGPSLVSAVTDELDKNKKKTPDSASSIKSATDETAAMQRQLAKTAGKSWFTEPVLGPIPGYGLILLLLGLTGGVGLAVKKIFF